MAALPPKKACEISVVPVSARLLPEGPAVQAIRKLLREEGEAGLVAWPDRGPSCGLLESGGPERGRGEERGTEAPADKRMLTADEQAGDRGTDSGGSLD